MVSVKEQSLVTESDLCRVEEEKTELTFPTYVFCSLPMGKIHWAVSDEKGQQKKMTMGLFW